MVCEERVVVGGGGPSVEQRLVSDVFRSLARTLSSWGKAKFYRVAWHVWATANVASRQVVRINASLNHVLSLPFTCWPTQAGARPAPPVQRRSQGGAAGGGALLTGLPALRGVHTRRPPAAGGQCGPSVTAQVRCGCRWDGQAHLLPGCSGLGPADWVQAGTGAPMCTAA